MNTEINLEYYHNCKRCNVEEARGKLEPGVGQHWGKWTCYKCNIPIWLPKPADDATKYRRESEHKELVAKFGKGFCQMCTRSEEEIKKSKGQTLEAHHVIPYQFGGPPTKENIWILCTSCHKIVEHQRRYVGDLSKLKMICEAFYQKTKEKEQAA